MEKTDCIYRLEETRGLIQDIVNEFRHKEQVLLSMDRFVEILEIIDGERP